MRLPDDVEQIWLARGKLAAIRYLHEQHHMGWRCATLWVSSQSPRFTPLRPLLTANRWHWLALSLLFCGGLLLGYQLDHWLMR